VEATITAVFAMTNLKLLVRLYYRPRSAMSGIIDEGSLLFSLAAALVVSILLRTGITAPLAGRSFSMLSTVLTLALLYAPATLLLVTLFEPVGSFGVAFRRDFGPLLACTLMAWAAGFMPVALGVLALPTLGIVPWASAGLAAAGVVYVLALMVLVVRTVFGARLGSALAVVGLSWFSFFLQGYLPLLASPFLLYWGYQYFRGDIGDVAWSFGARQGFKRYLEAATLNPRDASAHYQLGLIQQRRHQLPEAIERFRKAVEIDATELDAHYQLGRIARQQQRYEDAIKHFDAVVTRDEKFARYEVWREIGGAYLESGSFDLARWALDKYVTQRSHDPEGLYLLGDVLARLGDADAARQQFAACVEVVETTPSFRRSEVRPWGKLARQRLS
jgi:predicted negative regulator of RcsB-dependent stress response